MFALGYTMHVEQQDKVLVWWIGKSYCPCDYSRSISYFSNPIVSAIIRLNKVAMR